MSSISEKVGGSLKADKNDVIVISRGLKTLAPDQEPDLFLFKSSNPNPIHPWVYHPSWLDKM